MSRARSWLLFCGLVFAAIPDFGEGADKKVALVIGNSLYQHTTPLANPVADAKLITSALVKAGFAVSHHENVSDAQFEGEVAKFAREAVAANIALIYYAGHGIEHRGKNWLIPIDARLEDEFMLSSEAMPVDRLLEASRSARNQIIILDACRNNPFPQMRLAEGGTRSVGSRGLGSVELADLGSDSRALGTLIAFATSPNDVAKDGPAGTNSPYAEALNRWLREPGIDVSTLFGRVRDDVLAATLNKQQPWTTQSIGALMITPGSAVVSTFDPRQTELTFWQGVQTSDSAEAFQAYLTRYPKGDFASLATAELLRRKQSQSAIESDISGKGTLAVEVLPVDAEIWLNDRKVGSGSVRLAALTPGEFRLEVRSDGYVSQFQSGIVVADRINRMDVKLEKITPATRTADVVESGYMADSVKRAVEGVAAGRCDWPMVDALRYACESQTSRIVPILANMGRIVSIKYIKGEANPAGGTLHLFRVVHVNGALDWHIAYDGFGRMIVFASDLQIK